MLFNFVIAWSTSDAVLREECDLRCSARRSLGDLLPSDVATEAIEGR
jgi:hypothetical protein